MGKAPSDNNKGNPDSNREPSKGPAGGASSASGSAKSVPGSNTNRRKIIVPPHILNSESWRTGKFVYKPDGVRSTNDAPLSEHSDDSTSSESDTALASRAPTQEVASKARDVASATSKDAAKPPVQVRDSKAKGDAQLANTSSFVLGKRRKTEGDANEDGKQAPNKSAVAAGAPQPKRPRASSVIDVDNEDADSRVTEADVDMDVDGDGVEVYEAPSVIQGSDIPLTQKKTVSANTTAVTSRMLFNVKDVPKSTHIPAALEPSSSNPFVVKEVPNPNKDQGTQDVAPDDRNDDGEGNNPFSDYLASGLEYTQGMLDAVAPVSANGLPADVKRVDAIVTTVMVEDQMYPGRGNYNLSFPFILEAAAAASRLNSFMERFIIERLHETFAAGKDYLERLGSGDSRSSDAGATSSDIVASVGNSGDKSETNGLTERGA